MGTENVSISDDKGISVVIPIGPHPDYKKYLPECLESIASQMTAEDELFIVDDMAHLERQFIYDCFEGMDWEGSLTLQGNSWLLGCAASWNIGISLAANNLVLMMGSDDRLMEGCLSSLKQAYKQNNYLDAWYNLTIQVENETHSVFNNAAAITRNLWKELGGFPPSAGVGGPDSLAISIMIVHFPDRLIQVREGYPLYWCRTHSAQETPRSAGFFSSEIVSIRDKETARWTKPEWTALL